MGAHVNDRASSQNPAILIIESDQATRDLYERELGRRYRVRVCGDEQTARKIVEMCVLQAIVVEPNALEDDRWMFLAALHAAPATRRIPIVICTSLDERRRGLEMGVAAYLVKPVLPVTLAQTLARILHRAPAEEVNSPVE
jgi:PleD family two-component response regulator